MKKPIVAIVGRPNVGKSTLFNRILRKREAIVDDKPGVTRDRKYAPADWAGYEFDLLDTGGYVPDSNDVFEKAIRKQVEYALQEADVIIFVTDVTTGVTALDEEIALLLQKSGTQIILAVNKVDHESRELDLAEFYRLGIGDPIPVSAIAGRRIGDFLDLVIEQMPKVMAKEEQSGDIKIAVLGRPNVGKSSYVNTLLGQDKMIVTEIAGTTRDAIDTQFRHHNRTITLIDTAGLRRRSRVTENVEFFSTVRTVHALRRCDVAIILLDATLDFSDQDKKIISEAIQNGKGIAIGVNKWDLVEKETNTARHLELKLQESLREISFIPTLFISAKTKQRAFKLLDVAVSVFEERNRQLQTAELNRFLEKTIAENHPPAYGDKWVKINYVTQVKTAPPLFVFFTNEPKGIKKNYKNYLENKLRAQFGFFGVPVRFQFRKKN